MAINAYTGLMGSGKSYEVVSSVIVPAIQAGRRVVTNIDGINPQAIQDYILSKTKLTVDQLGSIVIFANDDINNTDFFPNDADPHSDQSPTTLMAGDLLAVDECWRFWSTDNKISEAHMTFFRMHRHYTHPQSGVSCDVALMIQDLGTLHRKLKAVVEMTTRTVKLKTLGMSSSYRIELYEGNKLTKKTRIDTFNKQYKADIFPLYKSYAAGTGNEKAIDKRQNVLLNPRIWIVAVLLIVFGLWGVWSLYGFFTPKNKSKPASQSSSSSLSGTQIQNGTPILKTTVKPVLNDYSSDWRITGKFEANGQNWIVVSNVAGKLRFESPSVFTSNGYTAIGEIEGQKATMWTGSSSGGLFTSPAQYPSPPPPPAPSTGQPSQLAPGVTQPLAR
jgi:zona occludens toxin